MASGAQLSVTEMRQAARHPVEYKAIAEHRRLGDIHLTITNVSAQGFMTSGALELGRGERLVVRFPKVGRIEAHLIWITGERCGFQFERIIRVDDFLAMIEALQPNPRLRKER
ncbi:MAG: PilZ domain-containing protein [Proteobacteria bacterium]|nr:PilZ domain-containing protein [Pseudomonadota bacterium]